MATSRVPATIDALVASWRSITELGDNKVIDGPMVKATPREAVYVGYDGDPEGEFTSADPGQEWAGLGAKRREQEFDIPCAVVVLVGDSNSKIARDRAYAVMALVEDKLRDDPSLGSATGPPPFVAEFNEGPAYTEPSPAGWVVRLVFNVHVKTRI